MKNKYKRNKIWCHNCDAELVTLGTKCSNCGIRQYGSKIKKPKKQDILKSEEDKEIFFNELENPSEPNEALRQAIDDYRERIGIDR